MAALTQPVRYGVLAFAIIIPCLALVVAPPIPQDQAYHRFADQRAWLGIANFVDVASNVMFLVTGLIGLFACPGAFRTKALGGAFENAAFTILFAMVVAVSAGSAYYHLAPDDGRLLWDRLPIALVFMTLFALIVTDRLSFGKDAKGFVLTVLLIAAVLSLIYWRATGDLRIYVGVQFIPIVVLPLLCLLFPNCRHIDNGTVWLMLGCYVLAKGAELADQQIFDLTGGMVGGHAWKHIFAGASVYFIARRIRAVSGYRAAPPAEA